MIAIALMLAAATAAAPPPFSGTEPERFAACSRLVQTDPTKAAVAAEHWRIGNGGGAAAQQCLGMAYVALDRWRPALAAFEAGAKEAELRRDGRAARLWVLAGNAALGGDDAAAARNDLDRALLLPDLKGAQRGEALIDRARAQVLLEAMPAARADLDTALKLVPGDPMAWLLSATLARRQADAPRATRDIAEAVRLAPDDAAVAYEAGNAASLAGADEAARTAWSESVRLGPDTPAGESAKAALAGMAGAADKKPEAGR